MPSLINVVFCFVLASLAWTVIGVAVTARQLPRGLVLALAPSTGWAVHSLVASTLFRWVEMGRFSTSVLLVGATFAALATLHGSPKTFWPAIGSPKSRIQLWLLLAGALILSASVIPAVFPHVSGDDVALAPPIFDHSKIALVNEIAQSGLPAVNPMFGEAGRPAPLPYYYLWHFSAAAMALSANVTGWEADVALTWFTALATLVLMMGLAAYIGRSIAAAGWALALAATASVRPFLADIFGYLPAYEITGWPSGFGAWLFQTNWAPQHAQSAACTIISLLMLSRLAHGGTARAGVLALMVAAGFESSSWVGGVTFALTAGLLGAWTLAITPPARRPGLILSVAIAASLAIVLAAPFMIEQIRALSARDSGFPIGFSVAEVLGDSVPDGYRRLLDIPAFYLLYLPVELCAIYLIGMPMLALLYRHSGTGARADLLRLCCCTIASGLLITDLLHSTLARNNDLAWRGALPAIMLLIAVAAAGLGASWHKLRPLSRLAAIVLIVLGAIQGGYFVHYNIDIPFGPAGREFRASIAMWRAVRQTAAPSERIINNPLFVAEMTPWPVNIAWALLSGRRSCYAGSELATAFIPLPQATLTDIDGLFARVFAGLPAPNDLHDLALKYDCRVAVVTASDPAWAHDPFASSEFYHLVEAQENRWRIYRSNVTGGSR
jgi:hypothetical protein